MVWYGTIPIVNLPKKTTRGWKLLVEWKDGSSDWIVLKDLKDLNPIETAEYVISNTSLRSPGGSPTSSDTAIASLARLRKSTGARPTSTPKAPTFEAIKIDESTGTDYWKKAINKELRRVRSAWGARDDLSVEDCRAARALIGHMEIKCHMVFNFKMDFTRKARFVAGGHLTDAPLSITYSSVVSRNSVRIAMLHCVLKGLDMCA